MNTIQKSALALASLLSGGQLFADASATYYSMRPQNTDAVRQAVGFQEKIYRYDAGEDFNGAFGLVLQYNQSFSPNDIARCLFGSSVSCGSSDCGSTINISGSLVANRGTRDWLADYFGLPQDFRGSVTVNPKIQNFVADFEFYFGLDQWARGLYARLNLPVNWTKWNLHAKQTVCDQGSCAYPAGYFAQDVVPADDLLSNPLDFFTGAKSATLSGASDEGSDGSGNINTPVFQPLNYSRWGIDNCGCDTNSKTRLAAVEMVFGYNFLLDEDYYFGLNIRSSAPTGNKPKGVYLFEPIAGNGHHWELGGGLDAHYVFWRSEDVADKTFSAYLDVNVVHLFNACQVRSFDLCGKANSRYMLGEKLEPATNGLGTSIPGGSDDPDAILSVYQFAGEYAPIANLTASKVKVSSAVEGDLSLKFAYSNGNGLIFDFGYNFWARSTEKIRRCGPACGSVDPLNGTTWAIKGDAFTYGYAYITDETTISEADDAAVALGATESLATIYGGTNNFVTDSCVGTDNYFGGGYNNVHVDSPAFAVVIGSSTDNSAPLLAVQDSVVEGQQMTSITPLFIGANQLDLTGIKGLSNRVFVHLDYSWQNHENWTPFLGLGASAEFGQSCDGNSFDCSSNNVCTTSCPTSVVAADSAACGSNSGCGIASGCASNSCGVSSACNSGCGNNSGCGTCSTGCSSGCSSSSSDFGSRNCALSQWAFWVKGGIAWN